MKTFLTSCVATMLFLAAPHIASAVTPATDAAPSELTVEKSARAVKKEWRAMDRAEKKAKKQEIKKAVRDYRKGDISEDTLLLVLITILIPPLGMYLYEGEITTHFWISLVLTLLFYVPGLVYTLIMIL